VKMASLTGQFGSGNLARLNIAEIVSVTGDWCYFNLHNNRAYGYVRDASETTGGSELFALDSGVSSGCRLKFALIAIVVRKIQRALALSREKHILDNFVCMCVRM